jgi:two-component system sensor histidine kinase AlgZ
MFSVNVAAALLVILTFSGVGLDTPWRKALEAFGVAFLFATCIGPLLAVAIPRISPWVGGRFRFPFNWAVLVVVMVGLAVAGSLLAITVLVAIGYIAPRLFSEWLADSLEIAIIITLTFGIFVTAYEALRARLDEATIALRTKERDEAEARRLATRAQLASLESRVQPHFLFNTLNSIAALIPNDPAGAERMTGQLASLMRASLDLAATPLVPLEQELKTTRDYLEIERVRFGERLRYEIHVPDELRSTTVPRMALQTLVENSIKYGVSSRRPGTSVVVRARGNDQTLRLTVEDDGPGFDAAHQPPSHGLALLRERLRMTFGERGILAVQSGPAGTTATIEIPL